MSFLSLLSTIAYNSDGTPVPTGYIQTVPAAGKSAVWTSTLGTATALSVSTLTGSTLSTRNFTSQTLSGLSTLTGSTLTVGSVGLSTLTGSTLTVGSVGLSTLTGSTVTTNYTSTVSLSVTSTMITLGPNTQSTMVNASQGSYAAESWQTAKSGLTNVRKLAMSATGQYQLIVSDATSSVFLSSDTGVTWSVLGATQGLPALT